MKDTVVNFKKNVIDVGLEVGRLENKIRDSGTAFERLLAPTEDLVKTLNTQINQTELLLKKNDERIKQAEELLDIAGADSAEGRKQQKILRNLRSQRGSLLDNAKALLAQQEKSLKNLKAQGDIHKANVKALADAKRAQLGPEATGEDEQKIIDWQKEQLGLLEKQNGLQDQITSAKAKIHSFNKIIADEEHRANIAALEKKKLLEEELKLKRELEKQLEKEEKSITDNLAFQEKRLEAIKLGLELEVVPELDKEKYREELSRIESALGSATSEMAEMLTERQKELLKQVGVSFGEYIQLEADQMRGLSEELAQSLTHLDSFEALSSQFEQFKELSKQLDASRAIVAEQAEATAAEGSKIASIGETLSSSAGGLFNSFFNSLAEGASAADSAKGAIGEAFKAMGGALISFGVSAGIVGGLKKALDSLSFAGSAAGFLAASAVGIAGGIALKAIGSKIASGSAGTMSKNVGGLMGGGGGGVGGGGGSIGGGGGTTVGGGGLSPPSIPGLATSSFSGLGQGSPYQSQSDMAMQGEFKISGDDLVAVMKRNNRNSVSRTGKTILEE